MADLSISSGSIAEPAGEHQLNRSSSNLWKELTLATTSIYCLPRPALSGSVVGMP